MKKILVVLFLFSLIAVQSAVASEINNPVKIQNPPPASPENFDQKACQNVFSLINVDLSVFSPRITAADVKTHLSHIAVPDGNEKPVSNIVSKKTEIKEQPATLKNNNDTSFFRLDLFKIVKIKLF